jgi:hypothetical protein
MQKKIVHDSLIINESDGGAGSQELIEKQKK